MGHPTWLIFENGVTDHNIGSLVTFYVPTIDLTIVFELSIKGHFFFVNLIYRTLFSFGFLA